MGLSHEGRILFLVTLRELAKVQSRHLLALHRVTFEAIGHAYTAAWLATKQRLFGTRLKAASLHLSSDVCVAALGRY